MTAKHRCRHNRCWVMFGGYLLWCYECGAIRRMQYGANGFETDGGWIKPVGKGGENPWFKLQNNVRAS